MIQKTLRLILALSAASTAVSASFTFDALENEMSEYEKKHSGIEKLSKSERQFIEDWLQKNNELYHFAAPTVSDVANIKWMYESIRVLKPACLENYDESKLIYKIAMCGILHNDAARVSKWLDHHVKMGCDHFYLYNCLSSDGYMKALSPYIEKGQVELIEWPKETNDEEIFKHAIALSQRRAKWLIGPITLKEYTSLHLSNFTNDDEPYSEIVLQDGAPTRLIVKPHR